MKRYTFSPRARKDLNEILLYIGKDDPDSALDFVTRLELMCQRLGQMPELGRKRDDLKAGLRSFPVLGDHVWPVLTDLDDPNHRVAAPRSPLPLGS